MSARWPDAALRPLPSNKPASTEALVVTRGTTKAATDRTLETASARPFALLFYFVGAYAWTWSLNLVKILAQRDIVSVPMPFIALDIVAGLGPLVASLAVSSYEAGAAGRRALLRQLLRWRLPGRWYAVAGLGPVVLVAVAFGMWVGTGG